MPSLRKRKGGKSPGKSTPSRVQPNVMKDIMDVNRPVFDKDGNRIDMRPYPAGYLQSFAVWGFVFFVYLYCAYPSISGGDTGELLVSTCNFSVAHPPGYPTYTLLYSTFTRFLGFFTPESTIAYRAAVFSCVLGSFASVFLFHSVVLVTYDAWSGLFAAMGFALNPTVWLYSIQGEVFALNNLLVALIIFLTVLFFSKLEQEEMKKVGSPYCTWPQLTADQVAYVGAFVCGLSLTNQHTSVFPVAASALAVLYALYQSGRINSKRILGLTQAAVLGLLPYIYVPLSALTMPKDTWGDQRTISGFMTHLLRKEYGTFQLAASEIGGGPGFFHKLAKYASVSSREFFYLPIPFFLAGVLASLGSFASRYGWKRTGLFWILIGYVSYIVVFLALSNLSFEPLFLGVQKRLWMQGSLCMLFFAGIGLNLITSELLQVKINRRDGSVKTQYLSMIQRSIKAISVFALASALLVLNFRKVDHHRNNVVEIYGKRILDSMPDQAILLVNGDLNNNAVKYMQQCEEFRQDLDILGMQQMSWPWWVAMHRHHYPNITLPGNRYHVGIPGSFNMKQFLDANTDRPIFMCGQWKYGDASVKDVYETLPYGACEKIIKKDTLPDDLTEYFSRSWKALPKMEDTGPYNSRLYGNETWENMVYRDMWNRMVHLSSVVSFYSFENKEDTKLLNLSKRIFDYIFSRDMFSLLKSKNVYRSSDYRAGGIIYGKWAAGKKGYSKAEAEKTMIRLWEKYLKLEPEDSELENFVKYKINPYTNDGHMQHHQ